MTEKTPPARRAEVRTPSDTEEFYPSRGIYQAATGDITVDMADEGTNITIPGLVGGILHPIEVTRVYATGTAAGAVIIFR